MFVAAGGAALVATVVHPTRAQTAERPRRIGVLISGAPAAGPPRPFVEAFRALGWIEGANIVFERRFAERPADLASMAAELVAAKVDVIVTDGTPAARAAKAATRTIPILIQVGADPVENGLVQSLSRPGGNLTGFFNGRFEDKTLELLKEVRPSARLVAYQVDPIGPATAQAASRIGLAVRGMAVRGSSDLNEFFAFIRRTKPDAVVVGGLSWMRDVDYGRIAQVLLDLRMPSISEWTIFPEAGGLMSFGPRPDLTRTAAKIDRLLRGDNPAETPIELPTRFHLAINLRTAKEIGVPIPPSVRARVDQYLG